MSKDEGKSRTNFYWYGIQYGNIGTFWHIKLWIKIWYSSKKILSDFWD